MSGAIGYYYKDSSDREIFHVPGVFVLIESDTEPTEVILEPRRLSARFHGLRRVIANDIRDMERVEVHKDDIQRIIDLCFSHKPGRARKYCERLFDWMKDKLSAYYQANSGEGDCDSEWGYDPDGFNPRFRGSLF